MCTQSPPQSALWLVTVLALVCVCVFDSSAGGEVGSPRLRIGHYIQLALRWAGCSRNKELPELVEHCGGEILGEDIGNLPGGTNMVQHT